MGFMKNKKAISSDTQFLVLVGILALFGWQMGLFSGFGVGGDGAVVGGTGDTITIAGLPACIGVDKTTVTLSATDQFDATVSVNGNHQYKINGGRATTVADGGTFDAAPGDNLFILWGQGNATGTSAYLNTFEEVEIPCAGTKTYSIGLHRNGSLTSRIFNEEGNLIDDALENETLDAGDVVSLRYELQGQHERGQFFYGGCAIVEYNNTAYDEVILDFDVGNEKISTPSYFTVGDVSRVTKTYTIPSIVGNQKLTGTIIIDVDDALNPGNSGGDILLHYRPNEYRLNSKTNTFDLFICGEDEDGNRVSNSIDSQGDTLQVD